LCFIRKTSCRKGAQAGLPAAKRTALQSLKGRFDYGLYPEKLGAVSAYLCDPATAPDEFLLTKSQYQAETGRVAAVLSGPAPRRHRRRPGTAPRHCVFCAPFDF